MYGDSATELIRHITRDHGEILPAYQYQLVEQVMKENDELYAENLMTSHSVRTDRPENEETRPTGEEAQPNNEETSPTNGTAPQPTNNREHEVHDEEADDYDRDEDKVPSDNIDASEKKIMVMQVRHTAKLWNKRCIVAYHYERLNRLKRLRWEYGNVLPKEIVKNLSNEELEWFTKYNDNLFSYMNSLNDGNGLDLTLYITPPKKLYIQVKCVRDYGQFDLEDGQPVMLKKDSIHYLPLNQCEKLIHQGILEQTSL